MALENVNFDLGLFLKPDFAPLHLGSVNVGFYFYSENEGTESSPVGCKCCCLSISRRGISECLPRLTCMVRGIGDPLVSVYARAYLCRVSRPRPASAHASPSTPPTSHWTKDFISH